MQHSSRISLLALGHRISGLLCPEFQLYSAMSNTDAVGAGGVSSFTKVCHLAVEQKARMAQACLERGLAVPELEKWFFLLPGQAAVSQGHAAAAVADGEEDEEEADFAGSGTA